MNVTRIKPACLMLLPFFLLSFDVSKSYASSSETIVLTKEIISSLEKCPRKNTMELNCKSYHQTTNYTCGPAAVMTLMRYYGMLSAKDMNKTTELRIAHEMSATAGDGGGTTPSQVESWLADHGFSVDSGQNVSTDLLIANVKKGIPTIMGANRHWVLAKGYNKGSTPAEDEVIFADSCCNVSVMSRDTIDMMWAEAHMPSNHCSDNVGRFIVAIPQK